MVVLIEMRGKPPVAEADMMLQQPEAHRMFSRGTCPWIMGLWLWHATQAPGRVWIVTCACTQASWWLQQQR